LIEGDLTNSIEPYLELLNDLIAEQQYYLETVIDVELAQLRTDLSSIYGHITGTITSRITALEQGLADTNDFISTTVMGYIGSFLGRIASLETAIIDEITPVIDDILLDVDTNLVAIEGLVTTITDAYFVPLSLLANVLNNEYGVFTVYRNLWQRFAVQLIEG
jgi:hypothetical protein